MRKRVLSIIATSALALAMVIVPASVSSATTPTVTYTVQLTNPAGGTRSALDSTETISIYSNSTSYSAYAGVYNGDSSSENAGAIVHGKAVFTDVPQNSTYGIYVHGNQDYATAYAPTTVATSNKSKKIAIAKLATISGKVTGPGGAAVNGVDVAAFGDSDFATATTNSSGVYTLHGLTTDSYRLQFNSHTSATTSVTSSYTWSYWHSAATWPAATAINASQETASTSATSTMNINGAVAAAFKETVKIWVPAASSVSNSGYQLSFIPSDGETGDEVDIFHVGAPGSLSKTAALNAGQYKLELTLYGSTDVVYWYTGNGLTASTNEGSAATITFAGTANKTINFGVKPTS